MFVELAALLWNDDRTHSEVLQNGSSLLLFIFSFVVCCSSLAVGGEPRETYVSLVEAEISAEMD